MVFFWRIQRKEKKRKAVRKEKKWYSSEEFKEKKRKEKKRKEKKRKEKKRSRIKQQNSYYYFIPATQQENTKTKDTEEHQAFLFKGHNKPLVQQTHASSFVETTVFLWEQN